MILAYHYLRYGRGTVASIPLFRRIAPLWDSSSRLRTGSWPSERVLPRPTASLGAGAERDPLFLEENVMHQIDATDLNNSSVELEFPADPRDTASPLGGPRVLGTGWLSVPGGRERRQYRIRADATSVECEMRVWRDGCRPGAWEYLGATPGGLERAIRRARDLRHLTDAYLSLCERAQRKGGIG